MVVQDSSTCLLGLTFLALGLLGDCLSLGRLLGPAHPAKVIALGCLWFSCGWFCFGLSLYLAGETWHLPHNQRPFVLTFVGVGLGFILMGVGLSKLAGVGKKCQARKKFVPVEEPPIEGVWPPAPRKP